MNSLPLDDVLEVQQKIDLYAGILLGSYSKEGGRGAKNPARRPQKGRPTTKDSRGRLSGENDVRGKAGNPEGQDVKPDGLPVNLGRKSATLRAAWVVVVGVRRIEIRLV